MRARPGYTIYLVLVIGSVFSVLFMIAMAAVGSESRLAAIELRKIQAKLLAQSGVVRAEYFMNGNDGHSIAWETPRFEEPVGDFGIIGLAVERFGLFSRVTSTGVRRGASCALVGLASRTAPDILKPSLTVTGHVGGLVLKNGSSVEGDIALHHGFVYEKKGGKPLNDYTRRLSLRESPPLPFDTLLFPELIAHCKERHASLLNASGASAGSKDDANASAKPAEPALFRKAYGVGGDYRIPAAGADNTTIAVGGTCVVGSEAKLRNTVVFARRIVCEGGTTDASLLFSETAIRIEAGRHNSQFFACDSIAVEKAASFGPLSVIAGYREKRAKDSLRLVTGGVYIGDDAVLRGTVICVSAPDVARSAASPSIVFGKNVAVTGSVITDGDCFLSESRIAGRLWLRSIVSRDAEGSYIDYLIKTAVTKEDDPSPFPLVGAPPLQLTVSIETIDYGNGPPRRTGR